MPLTRRDWVIGTGQLLAASALGGEGLAMPPHRGLERSPPLSLDGIRDEFPIAKSKVYLNNASVHPMSVAARRVVDAYVDRRVYGPRAGEHYSTTPDKVRASFARLVNADAAEISFVTSTEVGENFVVNGLGIPGMTSGNVVTDALHFEGSLYMYRSLKTHGVDVRIAMPRADGRVHMEDLAALVDRDTKLVAVSLVSFINGFQHDLKAVADLAHAHGAHVYADIIQAAGAVPIDLHATGVDFAAAATYKWLMGDFGLGFFYVRADLLDSVIKRTMYGFEQFTEFNYHIFPRQAPAGEPFTWTPTSGAPALFHIGTAAYAAMAALSYSLEWIQTLGLSTIQAHHQALTRRLQEELPRLGYAPMTPRDNPSSIVAYVVEDDGATTRRLERANVEVKVDQHMMRVAPAIYNNDQDIDALLNALR
jgi:selenocysteine lyase/cysteine desulfurase